MLKIIGVILTVLSCGILGFQISATYIYEVSLFRKLIRVLGLMENMLLYQCTPLPELCRFAANESSGKLRQLCEKFASSLDMQISPNVSECMENVLSDTEGLSKKFAGIVKDLGMTLGKFDVDGQVNGIRSVRNNCESILKELETDQSMRIRSIKTIGICAGAAIAILLV